MENNVQMKVRRKHKSKKEAWCINRATSKSTYCYNLDILVSRDLPVLFWCWMAQTRLFQACDKYFFLFNATTCRLISSFSQSDIPHGMPRWRKVSTLNAFTVEFHTHEL